MDKELSWTNLFVCSLFLGGGVIYISCAPVQSNLVHANIYAPSLHLKCPSLGSFTLAFMHDEY